MSRQHMFGYSASILLILSCGLLAQDEVQNINEEGIKAVVKEYLQAVQQGKNADIVALSDFRDAKEREVFEESLKKRGAVRQWDIEQELHVVRAKRHNGYTRALLLLPTKQGFLPARFSIREVRGHLKVIPDQGEKPKDQGLDVVSAKVAELQASLQGWKSAQGAVLAVKSSVFKEQLLEEIDALEYVVMKELQVVPGYGDLATRRNTYNDIRKLSNDELRAKMVEEIESALEALSP
ncbi:MAG TPA: hypothetical protein DCS43_15910 [Verrucomicrobia bacterium]|nr:hypothetical protein [Verrucomicrobiota bacterium]